MIGRLVGRVVEDAADGTLVLDVHGVGYEVTAPLGTLGRLRASGSEEVTLFIHTVVREDALLLYGFGTLDERSAFRALIGVSSVGPKIAVGILGALGAGELAQAIAHKETARLTKVPGIGKRTAERLVLELEGKLDVSMVAPLPGAPPARKGGKAEQLTVTLTTLGFKAAEAERALTSLGSRVESEPIDELVRASLKLLAK